MIYILEEAQYPISQIETKSQIKINDHSSIEHKSVLDYS